jgi:hypothetical protein
MHNSIPEYASTATISTVTTIPFHVKSIEKKFLKKWFSPPISSKPLSPQETEQRENRRKGKKKGKTRKKAPRVCSNKGEVKILRGEKHFNFKNPFWCDSIFSPSIIPFQKPFPKSLRKFS